MRDDTGDVLRELLERKIEAASEAAVRSGGEIAAQQLDGLSHLARVIEIRDAARPSAPPRRWPVAAALGVTLLIASILLFARVTETDIELDVMLSEVGFTLPSRQVVAGRTALAALGASGLREIHLPAGGRRDDVIERAADADRETSAIRLAADSIAMRRGSIDLAPIALPANARLSVRYTGVQRQYRLSLSTARDSAVVLRVDVNGPVRVAATEGPVGRVEFPVPSAIVLVPESHDVDLDLTFPDAAAAPFSPQLSAEDLTLHRVDEFMDGDRTVVRELSTVLAGSLYFESLAGEQRPLRPGERLTFARSRGEIRSLELRDGTIALKFAGRVRGMSTGSSDSRRSLMPTWLEWLSARHGLSLLWGTTLYLFGMVLAAVRWWRSPT